MKNTETLRGKNWSLGIIYAFFGAVSDTRADDE